MVDVNWLREKLLIWFVERKIKSMPKSYRTSLHGAGLILLGVANLLIALFDDDGATKVDFGASIALMTAGSGLLFARDQKAHEVEKKDQSSRPPALTGLFLLLAVIPFTGTAQAQEYSVATGAGFYPSSTPHAMGNVSLLVSMDEGEKTFSYTTLEMRGPTDEQPVYSTRTGLARLLQKSEKFSLYALGNVGVAANSESTSGAVAGGGLIGFGITRSIQMLVAVQAFKAPTADDGTWNPLVSIGFRLAP